MGLGDLKWSPQLPAFLGSLLGVLCAWRLAETEWYLLWSLLLAAILYALGYALRGRGLGIAPKEQATSWLPLHDVAGVLLGAAWLEGPSLLTLMTVFWSLRFFSAVQPFGLRQIVERRVGMTFGMVDLAPALCAFVLVLLPLRLLVDAPWSVVVGVHE